MDGVSNEEDRIVPLGFIENFISLASKLKNENSFVSFYQHQIL